MMSWEYLPKFRFRPKLSVTDLETRQRQLGEQNREYLHPDSPTDGASKAPAGPGQGGYRVPARLRLMHLDLSSAPARKWGATSLAPAVRGRNSNSAAQVVTQTGTRPWDL